MKQARKRLRDTLFSAQAGRCCYCRRPIELAPEPWGAGNATPPQFATIEHLQRRADGGRTTPDNVALACFACNTERHAMSWVEFATLKQQVAA